ncbi:MAG: ankyrin repeat domain-containing protein [Tatlockia sp.]|nr:ankyrin repeat domain-containing protein [Tatlockia sp.]
MQQKDEQTPLHIASMKNNCDYLKNNLLTSTDLLATFLGNTPLIWAIANSSVSFALALLETYDSSQVNVKSTSRSYLNTPLILSISKGWTHLATQGKEKLPQLLLATKLIEKGAEVNAVDVHGRSALHYACLHRNMEAIKTLVEAGAFWDKKDINDQTALDFCCLDYRTASTILQIATGGPEDYTFTLVKNNFNSSDSFYHFISNLNTENKFFDHRSLKQTSEFNKKINCALTPIYNHAAKLFNGYFKNASFESYANANNISSQDFLPDNLLGKTDSIEVRKIKLLLKIYFELKKTALTSFSQNEILSNTQREKLEEIILNALENPVLNTERELITKVGIVILNAVSILFIGLPLFINYCITDQFFFSHQTKSVNLLNHLKDEIATCTRELLVV